MLHQNISSQRFIAQPYPDVIIEFIPQDEWHKKSELRFTFHNYDEKNKKENYFFALLLNRCGYRHNFQRRYNKWTAKLDENNNPVYTVTGNKQVGEALTALLDFAATYPVKDGVIQELKLRLQHIYEMSCLKNKKIPDTVKRSNKFTLLNKIENPRSIRDTAKVTSHSKKTNRKKVSFSVSRYGDINDLTSFNSEIFALLVGSDHVGKARTVINEYGIRDRTVSKALPGFKTLHELKAAFTPLDFLKNLIEYGLGKMEAANHVFAEMDGHWKNIGIKKGKKGRPVLARVDFDQMLWPITSEYHAESREVAHKRFPVEEADMSDLPDYVASTPYNGLRKEILRKYPTNEDFERLDYVKDHPQFISDKWYTYLKYLLISDDMYQARAEYCNLSDKLKADTLECLKERREKFRKELLENSEFAHYVLENQKVIQQIADEFRDENTLYSRNNKKQSLTINIDTVAKDYHDLIKDAVFTVADSKVYPQNYNDFWKADQNCVTSIITMLDDYANPTGGWFLSGHWNRHHNERAEKLIKSLEQFKNAENTEKLTVKIKTILEKEIADTAYQQGTNQQGSYLRRLQYCYLRVEQRYQSLEEKANPWVVPYI